MPSIKDLYPAQVGVNSIFTTKGDLIARDATTGVRLPVGADGQALVADSLEATGLVWRTLDVGTATVSIDFVQPAVNSTVQVTLSTNQWIKAGMFIYIESGGVYNVISTSGSNLVTIRNEYSSNASPSTLITSGNVVAPAGRRGDDGTDPYALTTSGFTMPAVNGTVVVPFDQTDWNTPGQIVFIQDAGFFEVISISTLDVTLENLGYEVNQPQSTVIATAKLAVAAGIKGQDGINAFATTTSGFLQPAVNNTVTVDVDNHFWIAVGQGIFIQDAGNYTVTATGSTLTIRNEGGAGNAAPGASIIIGKQVSPSGPAGLAGQNAVVFNLAANFVQPAVNSTVSITVDTTEFTVAGAYIFIPTGGFYRIDSVTDLTTLVIENIGDTINAAPAANIFQPQTIVAAGRPGTDGTNGTNGTDGDDGATWYSKAGAPTNGEFSESVGDFVYDFTNNDIYEKTDGSTWTLRANINGATGSVSAAVSLALDHQTVDPGAVVDKLILYSKADGLYHVQPDATVRKIVEEEDLGTAAPLDVGNTTGDVVQVIDVGGNPGLPILDGSNLTGLSAEFDNLVQTAIGTTGSLGSGSDEVINMPVSKLAVLKSLETTYDTDIEIYSANEVLTGTNNDNVKLMLQFNGTNGDTTTTDTSLAPKTVTFNGAVQISNAQQRLATTTAFLNGSLGNYITVPHDSDFDFGTGDYTLEGYFYAISLNTSSEAISNCILSGNFGWGGTASGNARQFFIDSDAGKVYSTVEAAASTWTHFAVVRKTGVAKLYINGALAITSIHAGTYSLDNDGGNFHIGTLGSQLLQSTRLFNGYLEGIRITTEALYDGSFVPPAVEITQDLKVNYSSIFTYTGLTANTKLDTNLFIFNESFDSAAYKFKITNNDAGTQTIGVTAEYIELKPAFSATGGTGGTGGSITIQNEGTPLPSEDNLNFIGDLVDAVNNSGASSNDITITSGLTTLGDIIYRDGSGLARLPRGTQDQILSSDDTSGLVWVAAPANLDVATTKGDIIVYNGTAYIRVAVGADGQSLLADSAEASGVKWGTVGGGGDMLKSVYDPGDNGIVDLAENISGTPGNDKYYGTNASGTKGFYDLSAGGLVTVTDGTTTVNNVDTIEFTSGGTVTANGSTAEVAISGGSGGTDLRQVYAAVTASVTI